ncbi:hypothetical protein J7643_06330 [bacterium]|nr:hypothetical protein [bacterium]
MRRCHRLSLLALVMLGLTSQPVLAAPLTSWQEAPVTTSQAVYSLASSDLSHLSLAPSATLQEADVTPSLSPWGSVALSAAGGSLLSPLGLGVGYLYAGDPMRGVMVGLGGLGTVSLGVLAGVALSQAVVVGAQSGGESAGFAYVLVGLPVMALSLVGYYAWALVDVYHTTLRTNEALRKEATPE